MKVWKLLVAYSLVIGVGCGVVALVDTAPSAPPHVYHQNYQCPFG